jgi:hypothetical protein
MSRKNNAAIRVQVQRKLERYFQNGLLTSVN